MSPKRAKGISNQGPFLSYTKGGVTCGVATKELKSSCHKKDIVSYTAYPYCVNSFANSADIIRI